MHSSINSDNRWNCDYRASQPQVMQMGADFFNRTDRRYMNALNILLRQSFRRRSEAIADRSEDRRITRNSRHIRHLRIIRNLRNIRYMRFRGLVGSGRNGVMKKENMGMVKGLKSWRVEGWRLKRVEGLIPSLRCEATSSPRWEFWGSRGRSPSRAWVLGGRAGAGTFTEYN